MINRVVGAMFGLIALFLILTRAAEFNAIIRTGGGFITQQTAQLQGFAPQNTFGVSRPLASGSPATQKITSPLGI